MNSRIEKLVQKLKKSSVNVDFKDLVKILEFLGYICDKKNGGSHFIFRKSGKEHINIPRKKPVKAHYVKKVLKTYEEEK